MKQRLVRRQIVNLRDLPRAVQDAVLSADSKKLPVHITVPRLGPLELPMPKGRKLQ